MKKLILVLIATAVFAGCHFTGSMGGGISGSGKIQTVKRDVPNFNSVELTGNYQAKIAQGKDRLVQIEADDNILPLIKTEVQNNRLKITSDQSINPSKAPVVTITVPEIREVSGTGANDMDVTNLKNDSFSISSTGAGKIHCAGETATLAITAMGASSINTRDLHAKSASVHSSGAGSISVFASDVLDVELSGAGSVDYYGNPKTVNKNITGFGSLNKKGE